MLNKYWHFEVPFKPGIQCIHHLSFYFIPFLLPFESAAEVHGDESRLLAPDQKTFTHKGPRVSIVGAIEPRGRSHTPSPKALHCPVTKTPKGSSMSTCASNNSGTSRELS